MTAVSALIAHNRVEFYGGPKDGDVELITTLAQEWLIPFRGLRTVLPAVSKTVYDTLFVHRYVLAERVIRLDDVLGVTEEIELCYTYRGIFAR